MQQVCIEIVDTFVAGEEDMFGNKEMDIMVALQSSLCKYWSLFLLSILVPGFLVGLTILFP